MLTKEGWVWKLGKGHSKLYTQNRCLMPKNGVERVIAMKERLIKALTFAIILAFSVLTGSQPAIAVSLTSNVDGFIRDGLYSLKDGIPDDITEGVAVQVLDVERPSLPFEDRGIIEFALPTIPVPIVQAQLSLNVRSSEQPYPFTIDVFTYTGDGLLSLDDFNAGSFFTSFEYSLEPFITLDVTDVIKDLYANGDDFAGFNFQFAIPSTIAVNGPYLSFNSLEFPPAADLTITSIPEPATVLLFCLGGLPLRRRK